MDAIDAYMHDAHAKRFQWGTNDCFLFAAGAVAAVTGKDYMENMRGQYRDETTAEVFLREHFGTMELRQVFLTVALEHGKQIEMHDAQNGDIACVQFPKQFLRADKIDQSCGLGVWYEGKVFVLTPTGLMQVPAGNRIIDVWSFR